VKGRRNGRTISALAVAAVLVGTTGAAQERPGDVSGAEAPRGAETTDPDALGRRDPAMLTFGTAPEQFWLVRHGARLSIWADHMPADKLLTELQSIGGPKFSVKEPLTRPVTLSLHRVTIEDLLRKVLDGYNFALYYERGHLAHVNVLLMMPGRSYKVASPIESRVSWTRRALSDSDGP
jgi:hypothetical protein